MPFFHLILRTSDKLLTNGKRRFNALSRRTIKLLSKISFHIHFKLFTWTTITIMGIQDKNTKNSIRSKKYPKSRTLREPEKFEIDWLVNCHKATCTLQWTEGHIRKYIFINSLTIQNEPPQLTLRLELQPKSIWSPESLARSRKIHQCFQEETLVLSLLAWWCAISWLPDNDLQYNIYNTQNCERRNGLIGCNQCWMSAQGNLEGGLLQGDETVENRSKSGLKNVHHFTE